jgi:hypothetical protein
MRALRLLFFALVLIVVPKASGAQQAPLVVFIDDNRLQASAVSDSGADGLTRLADLFRSLGARTQLARLNQGFPNILR